jgi:NAD(P)-dependent dehydrogenase (short-subunit alcohol dehydrogenase family)
LQQLEIRDLVTILMSRELRLSANGVILRPDLFTPGVDDIDIIYAKKDIDIKQDLSTAFVPMKRLRRPEEIADAVLWLCSDAASYVTGQSISVDGDYVMR